jgi:inhibitor of cysteine peptidase
MKPVLLLLGLVLLASCAAKPPPPPRPPQPLLTAADDGRTVDLIVGETVDLHLESNPTTGYSWNSLRLPDWKIVKQTNHAYQGPESTSSTHVLVGAGGKEHWKFLAVAEGETGIDLVYRRGWEDPQEMDQKLSIQFKVSKGESR